MATRLEYECLFSFTVEAVVLRLTVNQPPCPPAPHTKFLWYFLQQESEEKVSCHSSCLLVFKLLLCFYSAAFQTRHQTSLRLLCDESFSCEERSCLDLPCVFQYISLMRRTDKLKQANFNRAQEEDAGGFTIRPTCCLPLPLTALTES